jgi:uracil-DNA glycosylase
MAQGLKNALTAWLEAREDFDLLGFLPDGVASRDLLDQRKLARAGEIGSKSLSMEKPQNSVKPQSSVKTQSSVKPQNLQKPHSSKTAQDFQKQTSPPPPPPSTPPPTKTASPVVHQKDGHRDGGHGDVQSLDLLREKAQTCQACSLRLSRKHVLFGEGNPQSDLMVIADAPSAEENACGQLFGGPAGELLDKMLGAIQFAREDYFLVHAVKCHPADGRHAGSADYTACRPWLEAQIRLIQPRLLFVLGKTAGNLLLGHTLSLGDLRSKEHQIFGVPFRVSYHPTALLRNSHWKRPAWEDLQSLRKHFDRLKDVV